MDTALWVLRVAVFWLVTVPLLTLVHELGHAVAGLLTTGGWVRAAIGSGRKPWTLHPGRLTIELRLFSGFVGFCNREENAGSSLGEALFYAGGPFLSLVSAVALSILSRASPDGSLLEQVLEAGIFAALWQLVVTLVPVRYPSWMGSYAGYLSDGAMILRLIRGKYPVTRADPPE